MSINGIGLNNAGYIGVKRTYDGVNVPYAQNDIQTDAINFTSNPVENTDTFEKETSKNTDNSTISSLREEFSEIKNSQGLIGKAWGGIKNLFNTKNSANNIENILNKAENGEISTDEAKEALEKYKEGQKMCVDIAGDIISGIGAVGAAALAPVTGGASLLVAAGAGAGIKTLIKTTDAAIGGRDYKLSDFGYDLITGSINGVMAPLSNAIGGAAGTGVAKALGLNAVETCAKEAITEAGEAGVKAASKSFISRLLAKQGMSYVAKEGAKGGISLLAAKAASYGVDMAVDGALSGTTDAFARALAEGRFEDMPDDMLKGALGGAIGGVVIGGSTRLVFSGASKLNQKLFNNAADSASEIEITRMPELDTSDLNAGKAYNVISQGTFDSVFDNLDDSAKALLEANPKLKEFYKTLDSEALSRLTSDTIKDDLLDTAFMKGLDIDFSAPIQAGSAEAQNLAAVISKRNSYLQDSSVAQFKSATDGTGVHYYDRSKKMGSTLDKLNSKLPNKVVSSFDDANAIIADGVGTRAIFNSLTGDEALSALKNANITDDELKILKNLWKLADTDALSEAENALLNKANRALAEAQTQGFVDRLARALSNNEISMTEINNYAGRGGISYFSDTQIKQLRDAWAQSLDAQNGGQFKIVTKLTPDSELAKDLGFSEEYIAQISKNSSKNSGYTACQANFKYKNGALGEGQFRGAQVQEFAEYEHFPYDAKKGKNTITEKITQLMNDGKTDVAQELEEYQNLVKVVAKDKPLYGKYDDYLRQTYNYLRKKELGIADIVDGIEEPVLNLPGLSAYQNELLSKECLQSLSNKEFYTFVNKKAA